MIALSAPGDELGAAVAWVSRLCPTRPAFPQLGGVLLDADIDGLTLTATDLDQWARVTVKAAVSAPGATLVSGRLLAAVTKAASKSADVELFAGPSGLTVKAGRSTWTVPAMEAELFPAAPELGDPVATLDGAGLAGSLDRVLPAVARNHEPPLHSGVLLTGAPEALLVLATDRYRLAEVSIPWTPAGTPLDIVAPVELVELAARAGGTGPMRLHANGSVVSLASRTHRITGRLIAEKIPNVRRIIPAPAGRAFVTANTASLIGAVESAMVVSQVEGEPVCCAFTVSSVSVTFAEQGRASVSQAALSGCDGEAPDRIWFRPLYLLAAFRAAQTEQVLISFGPDEKSSVLVLPLGDDGQPEPGYLHLLMPVSESRRNRGMT